MAASTAASWASWLSIVSCCSKQHASRVTHDPTRRHVAKLEVLNRRLADLYHFALISLFRTDLHSLAGSVSTYPLWQPWRTSS